ncbi:MAG TPA: hypothetical protein VFA84_06235 [Acidimicrobiales bacterium]|nr:hypothetical protein [Acidimicrobiales bacterium]
MRAESALGVVARAPVLAGARTLAVPEALAGMFPNGALQRGATVVVDGGQGAVSLAMVLLSRVGWAAVVGVGDLGVVAAAELGVCVDRLALVPRVEAGQWATVVGALLDSVDVVVARPPAHLRAGDARRLTARARERGAVLVPLLPGRAWADGAEVRLVVTGGRWEGPGAGDGHLVARRLTVAVSGRGAAARPREVEVWLPEGRFAGADADQLAHWHRSGTDSAPTERAEGPAVWRSAG